MSPNDLWECVWVCNLTCPALGDQFAGTSCDCVHHAQEKPPVNFGTLWQVHAEQMQVEQADLSRTLS